MNQGSGSSRSGTKQDESTNNPQTSRNTGKSDTQQSTQGKSTDPKNVRENEEASRTSRD